MEFFGMDFSCAYGSLRNGSIPDKDCLLPLLSKILGYCIVAASTTVKLPQILKILKHRSVRGLSALAFELEVVGYTIGLAYCLHKGMPFSAFGELAFLLVQAIILVAVIYYFSQPLGAKTWIRPLIYCAVAPTILAGQIDPVLFEALYASQHAIFFFARLPQIWANFRVHVACRFPSYVIFAVVIDSDSYGFVDLVEVLGCCIRNAKRWRSPSSWITCFLMHIGFGDLTVMFECLVVYFVIYECCCIVCFIISVGLCLVVCDFDNVLVLKI